MCSRSGDGAPFTPVHPALSCEKSYNSMNSSGALLAIVLPTTWKGRPSKRARTGVAADEMNFAFPRFVFPLSLIT